MFPSSDNFNPSRRESVQLKRFCSECQSAFTCDGSCEKDKVIEDRGFCFCPQCWLKVFKISKDEGRGKCTILEKHLNTQRKI